MIPVLIMALVIAASPRRVAGDRQVRPAIRHDEHLGSGRRHLRRLADDRRHGAHRISVAADRRAALARRGRAALHRIFAPEIIRKPVAMVIELLAAIPSVVYGLWGLFVLMPVLRHTVFPFLRDVLGFLPFFRGVIYGPSVLAASIILAIMVMPFIMSVAREVLLAVPNSQREAAMALGATRWEAVRSAIIPYARSGIIGAIILGLGRALGETMAVTMLIGNSHDLSASLFAPGYTMAAAIANEFNEAATPMHYAALTYVALLLFAITVLVNAAARRLLIWRVNRGSRRRRRSAL